ncbi:MAG: alcohol dehydrogenase [Nitrospiraceae bacterium]|nr:alcohol dehydrogenase [Nitrospiraceae bacterium]MSR23638.1 alcohol dehydrogenase [Nitrospiraceae bacterium]
MKAVVFHEHGGPEKLKYEDRPDPQIKPDEVLVRVKACALNHLDIWIRQGIPAYQIPLPHISGCDVAGQIERVGSQVWGVKVGQKVFVSPGLNCGNCDECKVGHDNLCPSFGVFGAKTDGGYAEFVAVPGTNVIAIPGSLTFEQAAAFPLVSVTAWHMVVTLGWLRHGETALIMGAGSGVGSMAIQIAKYIGAKVITTVGSEEKVKKALVIGADEVINHATDDMAKRVFELTGGQGVDVVIEHIGPQVWDQCLKSLAKGGRLVTCGATTGAKAEIDLRYLYSRHLTLKGSYLGTKAELLEAAKLVGAGKLTPVIDRVYPLQEARAAQEQMLSRKLFGKLVLTV